MEKKEELYKTNYSVAINWCNNSYVMCNKLSEIDISVWENMIGPEHSDEDDDEDCYKEFSEIFQWFITDASTDDVDYLVETFPGLLFTYSELLDRYVLCVTHFGTGWEYVYWETTNAFAKAELGQEKKDIL